MSKSANLQLVLSSYKADGSLENDWLSGAEGLFSIASFTKGVRGELTVVDTDGVKTIDFEGITPQGFILINRGDGSIDYKVSGAAAKTGTLLEDSMVAFFNTDIDQISVETGNVTPINYEYYLFG